MISILELFRCIATYIFSTVATRNTWVSDQHCGCWSSGYKVYPELQQPQCWSLTHVFLVVYGSRWYQLLEIIRIRKQKVQKRSSIWQLCRHWWHHKLSLWQLTVPPVTQRWQIDDILFSVNIQTRDCCPVFWLAHCINITLLGCCRLTLWMLLLQESTKIKSGLGVDHTWGTIHIPHQL